MTAESDYAASYAPAPPSYPGKNFKFLVLPLNINCETVGILI